jgi:hypothetical protein
MAHRAVCGPVPVGSGVGEMVDGPGVKLEYKTQNPEHRTQNQGFQSHQNLFEEEEENEDEQDFLASHNPFALGDFQVKLRCEIFDEAGADVSGRRFGIIVNRMGREVVPNGTSGSDGRTGHSGYERHPVD